MEDSNLTFNLPYKVKTIIPVENVVENVVENEIKTNINFSIMMITHNDEDNIKNISGSLTEFKKMGGDIFVLDISSKDKSIELLTNLGYIVEDGTSFLRYVDDEMCEVLNNKFNFEGDNEDEKLIKNNDFYIDYSGAMNYLASLSNTDIVLFIKPKQNIINLDINNLIDFFNKNRHLTYQTSNSNIIFYNKKFYSWKYINNCILRHHNIRAREQKGQRDYYIPEHIIDIFDNINFNIDNDRHLLIGLAVNCYLDPNNSELSQLLAIEILKNNYDKSAYYEFNRNISISKTNIEKCVSYVYIGDFFIKNERISEGLEYYNKAYLECSKTRIPLYKIGEYFYLNGDRHKTIFYLEGCLNISEREPARYNDDFMYNDGPHSMLYVAYWWIGKPKKGKYHFDKALSIDPYNKLYIDESIYHYKYKGNIIHGKTSFNEIQYLYNKSTQYDSILEIYPDNPRNTHALVNGCKGLVTVLLTDINQKNYFLETLENPGNLKILDSSPNDFFNKIKNNNKKFDMVIINGDYNYLQLGDNTNWQVFDWESITNKLICGTEYNFYKDVINEKFEISGINDNIWYKNISQFEKIIIYKRKDKYE